MTTHGTRFAGSRSSQVVGYPCGLVLCRFGPAGTGMMPGQGTRRLAEGTHARSTGVSAEFFALAFIAALNPKLLAIDLLLVENRRPRAMYICILAGGIATGATIGLIDVLLVHADHIRSQGQPSAAVDLALGLILLVLGALILTGVAARLVAAGRARRRRPRRRRRTAAMPGLRASWASPGSGWLC